MATFKSTQRAKIGAIVGDDARYKFLPKLARERAGVGADYDAPAPKPRDQHAPQAPEDKQGSDRGDTREGWPDARGETAETMPAFDRMQSRKPQPHSPA